MSWVFRISERSELCSSRCSRDSIHARRLRAVHPPGGPWRCVRESFSLGPVEASFVRGIYPSLQDFKKTNRKTQWLSTLLRLHRLSTLSRLSPPSPAWRLAVSTSGLVALFPCHENRPVTSEAKISQELQVRMLLAKTLISPDLKEEWHETYEAK